MRRKIFWFLVTGFTFVIGVGAAFTWFVNMPEKTAVTVSMPQEDFSDKSQLTELTTCDLANNPAQYDGQFVRVKAKLNFFIHGFSFLDRNCYRDEQQIGVKFNDERSAHIQDKLDKDARPDDYGYGQPIIITIGRFKQVKPSRKSDAVIDNVKLTFEIYEIEEVILDEIKN